MATMLQLKAAVIAAAPGGLSIHDVARLLETDYRAASSLVSHAHGGRSRTLKLYHRHHSRYGLYFFDAADAAAFDIEAYAAAQYAVPKATSAPMQTRVYEYVATMARGATHEQIRLNSCLSLASSTTLISQMVKAGRLHAIGPMCWKRYFTDAALMESLRDDVLAEIQRMRVDSREASRNRKNAIKRAKWAATADQRPVKPPKAPKAARPKKDPTEQWRKYMIEPRHGRKKAEPKPAKRLVPGVELLAPPKPDRAPVKVKQRKDEPREAYIPPHVKVQVCPGYRGDVRFMPPSGRVVGGFATMGIGRYLDSDKVAA